MRDLREARAVARFATGVASEVAQRTRANRRGLIKEKTGSLWVVQYGRGTVTVGAENIGEESLAAGMWVTLGLVEGRLVITGPSAFQGHPGT